MQYLQPFEHSSRPSCIILSSGLENVLIAQW
uniref:Uncharacterized protein n=1 Tax=Arundo donax TaxID=35708 RepID=A0A0A9A802_ARUDO